MSAVRLDPFQRIVGVSWPSGDDPAVVELNVARNLPIGTGQSRYDAAIFLRGDVRADVPTGTVVQWEFGGGIFRQHGGTIVSPSYNAATSFTRNTAVGTFSEVISTPTGRTFLDLVPSLFIAPSEDIGAPVAVHLYKPGGVVLYRSIPLPFSLYYFYKHPSSAILETDFHVHYDP